MQLRGGTFIHSANVSIVTWIPIFILYTALNIMCWYAILCCVHTLNSGFLYEFRMEHCLAWKSKNSFLFQLNTFFFIIFMHFTVCLAGWMKCLKKFNAFLWKQKKIVESNEVCSKTVNCSQLMHEKIIEHKANCFTVFSELLTWLDFVCKYFLHVSGLLNFSTANF